jgi:hypothetical protein
VGERWHAGSPGGAQPPTERTWPRG